jgi:hypothetical protein
MIFGLILALHLHWLLVVFAIFVVFKARQARREAQGLTRKVWTSLH